MIVFLLIIYYYLLLTGFCISSVHRCLKEAKDIPNNRLNGRTLSGIIGFGWDDLQSIRTKPVFFEEFKLCKAEPTGHYLIPDTVVAVPILKVKLDQMATFYESFKNFKDEISNTFIASAGGGYAWLSASGSFSKINEKTKENFVNYKSSLLYTKLQYDAFNLYQDSVGSLTPGFTDKIEEIAYSLSQKFTYQAKYLAGMIVKDYGTHYISSANTGAMIEQKIFIDSNFAFSDKTTLKGVRIAAAAKLGTLFKASFSANYTVSNQDQEALSNITKSSFIETNGGPDIHKILSGNGTFNVDNIVPYFFDGDWLYRIVSKRNFPNISIDSLLNIQHLLKNATEIYYEKNTIHGCMDINSPNFDFKANFDDGSCISNNDSYTFGGLFQTCKSIEGPNYRCDNLQQNNTIIGAPKCDETMFESVKIFETIYEFEKRQEIRVIRQCVFCAAVNVIFDFIDRVKIEAFWCRKKANINIPPEKGALFGGVYENSERNMVTGEFGCPGSYKPYRIGRNTTVCLSYQYEQDRKYSIPFAGFFSCQSQMGFALDYPGISLPLKRGKTSPQNGSSRDNKNENFKNGEMSKKINHESSLYSSSDFKYNGTNEKMPEIMTHCPKGFTQQILPIEMNCNIFYCVKKHTVIKYRHAKIIRPPFALPEIAANKYSETNIRALYNGIEILSIPISNFNDMIGIYGKRRKNIFKKFDTNFYIHQIEEKLDKASNHFTASANKTLENIKKFKRW